MELKNCTCNGDNENCNKCGGRGYIEIIEEIQIKSAKQILNDYYNKYSLKIEFIKELLQLEDIIGNEEKFKEGISFYENEKHTLLMLIKHFELIKADHLIVPLHENYYGNIDQAKVIIAKAEEIEMYIARAKADALKKKIKKAKPVKKRRLILPNINVKKHKNIAGINKKNSKDISSQSNKHNKSKRNSNNTDNTNRKAKVKAPTVKEKRKEKTSVLVSKPKSETYLNIKDLTYNKNNSMPRGPGDNESF
jgi:hypothetical protein